MESVFFLGLCTPRGFVSHYDTLFQEVKRITVIKGGAGCGKSTFMRSIAKEARQHGVKVQGILCSSDPDSLDGILLPELSVAYVDGTAPHVMEPKLCGGSMNYLNFGDFYDHEAMAPNEEAILEAQKKNSAQYPYVTHCLSAGEALLRAIRYGTRDRFYTQELESIGECLCLSVLKPVGDQGALYYRYLSAVTPKGLYFCGRTPGQECRRVYVLKDNYYLAPTVLQLIADRALSMGHRCLLCHTPLEPEGRPAHLLLPDAQVAIVSESRDLPYTESCFCRIDLDATLPPKLRKELDFYHRNLSAMLYQAAAHMREAKRLHDRIEQLCKPFVDFSAVNDLTETHIQMLFPQ